MNWDYVAGFFDGEGCVVLGDKTKAQCGHIVFTNTNREVLAAIQTFLGVGRMYSRAPQGAWSRCYYFKITCTDDLKVVLPELSALCFIKRAALLALFGQVTSRRSRRRRALIQHDVRENVVTGALM